VVQPELDIKTIVYLVDNMNWVKWLARHARLMWREQWHKKEHLGLRKVCAT